MPYNPNSIGRLFHFTVSHPFIDHDPLIVLRNAQSRIGLTYIYWYAYDRGGLDKGAYGRVDFNEKLGPAPFMREAWGYRLQHALMLMYQVTVLQDFRDTPVPIDGTIRVASPVFISKESWCYGLASLGGIYT